MNQKLFISFENSANRKVQAKEQIKQGEILFSTKALCVGLQQNERKSFCQNCLLFRGQLLQCGSCKSVSYCSLSCQKKDWKLHKNECKIMKYLKENKWDFTNFFQMTFRLYLLSQTDEKIKQMLEQLYEDKAQSKDSTNEQENQENLEYCYLILKYLNEEMTEDKVKYITSLMNKIKLNTFSIYEALDMCRVYAIGIFYPNNFVNHSCIPNATQIFIQKKQNIIALKDIEKGEEICISYAEFGDVPSKTRSHLEKQYHFVCNCQQCAALICEDLHPNLKLKCQKCKCAAIDFATNSCLSCNEIFKKEEIKKLLETMDSEITQLSTLQNAKEQLIQFDSLQENYFMQDCANFELINILNQILFNLLQEKEYDTYLKYCKKYITYFNTLYSNLPLPMKGLIYAEISALFYYQKKFKKSIKYGEIGKNILTNILKIDQSIPQIKDLLSKLETSQLMLQNQNSTSPNPNVKMQFD